MSDSKDDLEEFGLGGAERVESEVSAAPITEYEDGVDVLGEEIRGMSSAAFQKALAQRLAARPPFISKVSKTKIRQWMIGFGPVTIPGRSIQTVTQRVSCLYKPTKIIAYGDTADVSIESMFVGNKAQMEPGASLPLAALTSGIDYPMAVAQPAIDISIQLRNRARKAKKVGLTLCGDAVS